MSESQNDPKTIASSTASDSEDDDEEEEEQARELRAALDTQLERVRSLSMEEQLELSVEEQLTQLLLLVSQYPDHALHKAVLMTNDDSTFTSTVSSSSSSGRLPIHLACDTNAPIQVIQWLLEHDVDKLSIKQKDAWGDLPIHTACSRKDVDVVQLLLDSDPQNETIYVKDNHGALPIHMACRYNAPAPVIQMLLERDTGHKTLLVGGMFDQLPLHVACRCNMAPESIALLLDYDADKRTVLVEDDAGRLALHVAFLRNSHTSVYELLLQAMLSHRIERVGLELWKRDLRLMIQSLSTHERDFTTSEKLEMTREVFREWLELAVVLELALWKTKCLSLSNNVSTMQDIVDQSEHDNAFNAHDYKQECHVKSGAEIIIPRVMSFLEDEPIAKLLDQYGQ